jgi:hypothetical protein
MSEEQADIRSDQPNPPEIVDVQAGHTRDYFKEYDRIPFVFTDRCVREYGKICKMFLSQVTMTDREAREIEDVHAVMDECYKEGNQSKTNLAFTIQLVLSRYKYCDTYLTFASKMLWAYCAIMRVIPRTVSMIEVEILRIASETIPRIQNLSLRGLLPIIMDKISEASKECKKNKLDLETERKMRMKAITTHTLVEITNLEVEEDDLSDTYLYSEKVKFYFEEKISLVDLFLCVQKRDIECLTAKKFRRAIRRVFEVRRANIINWAKYYDDDGSIIDYNVTSKFFKSGKAKIKFCSSHAIGYTIFHAYKRELKGSETINIHNYKERIRKQKTAEDALIILDFVLSNWGKVKTNISNHGACYLPPDGSGDIKLRYGMTLGMLWQAGYVCAFSGITMYLMPPVYATGKIILAATRQENSFWHVYGEVSQMFVGIEGEIDALIAGQSHSTNSIDTKSIGLASAYTPKNISEDFRGISVIADIEDPPYTYRNEYINKGTLESLIFRGGDDIAIDIDEMGRYCFSLMVTLCKNNK